MEDVQQLLARYDRPGPRYTSYPTAVEFHEGCGRATYEERLARAAARDDPLSFYIHLPFCEERCLFCGCNVVVTHKREIAARYLGFLHKEIRTLADRLGERRRISQYHWGGGTPTYLSPDQMRELHAVVAEHFELEPDAEVSLEVDPRVTTKEHLAAAHELGFNRLSLGVQDFDEDVQREIRREQSFELTRGLVDTARAIGFESINADLIYGLPRQNAERFRESLEQLNVIRPERVAVYSYAHVPWIKAHQKKMDASTLPAPAEKLRLFATAVEVLGDSGYLSIGMDHFALPDDELGRAARDGTLGRNFMGYTVHMAPDMVACGLSGIGDVSGAFFQNRRKLHEYEKAVAADGLTVERGYIRTDDDELRAAVIASLMCRFRLDRRAVEREYDIDFAKHFAVELGDLQELEGDGLVTIDDEAITVTERGRLFVRNICMTFDAYLDKSRDRPVWSRTV